MYEESRRVRVEVGDGSLGLELSGGAKIEGLPHPKSLFFNKSLNKV